MNSAYSIDACMTRKIPKEVKALFAALRLCGGQTEQLGDLNDAEWKSLLSFCEMANLTFPLLQIEKKGCPDWVVQHLETNAADNARRFERVKATYVEVAKALESSDVQYVVMKGFAKCPEYVSDPRLLMQSDIDLYCPGDVIHQAFSALSAIGYHPHPDQTEDYSRADHLPTMFRDKDWTWRGNAFDPEMPLPVELHFCLWNVQTTRFSVPDLDGFWGRRVMRSLEDFTFPTFCDVDGLGYHALHTLRNLLNGDRIAHYVYELAVFLHRHADDTSFWASWRELHDDTLRSMQAIAFRLAKSWFRCNTSPEVEAEIDNLSPAIQNWFQSFLYSPLEALFHLNKDRVWLHLSLLNSAQEKQSVLRKVLWPAPKPPVRTPSVDFDTYGRARKGWPTPPNVKYLLYFVSRSVHHTRVLPSALWHGFRWWASQRELGRQFWIFLAASFFFDLGLSVYFFLFNLFLIGHGFTEKTLGFLTSAMAAGSIAGAIPAGKLARRVGLQKALLVFFIFATLIFLMRSLTLSHAFQLALAFLAGMALSTWAVCLSPTVAQLSSERTRPFAFSLVFSIGIVIPALGGLVGGILPGWLAKTALPLHSLEPIQVVLLISCGIFAMGIWPVLKLQIDRAPILTKTRRTFNPFLVRLLPAIALWSMVDDSFSPFANVYFARHLQMSLPLIGLTFSFGQLAQVLAVLAAPLAFRKFGLLAGIIYMQIATSLALGSLAMARGATTAAFIYVGYTALQCSEPGMYSLLMNGVPAEERDSASALNAFVVSCSQAIAAAFAGASITRLGYSPVLWITSAISLAAAGLFWRLLRSPHSVAGLER